MSLKETDQMIAAADKAGVKFGCLVQCRVRKAVCAMKQAIVSGRFGKLLHADAYMKWYRGPDITAVTHGAAAGNPAQALL